MIKMTDIVFVLCFKYLDYVINKLYKYIQVSVRVCMYVSVFICIHTQYNNVLIMHVSVECYFYF